MSHVAAMLAPSSTSAPAAHGWPRHTPNAAASAHTACKTKPIGSSGTGLAEQHRGHVACDVHAVSRQRDGNQEQRGGSIIHLRRCLTANGTISAHTTP